MPPEIHASRRATVRFGNWRNQFIIAPVVLVLVVFFWRTMDERGLGFWIAIICCGAFFMFGVLPCDTIFDPARGYIERRWSLFGIAPIFRRRLSPDQFSGICRRNVPGEDKNIWMVGLERISGRPVYINYFYAEPGGACPEADQFALELSRVTGLPFIDGMRFE